MYLSPPMFLHMYNVCDRYGYTTQVSGTSGGVTVSKLDSQTYTSEFESHWVPHSFGLVPHRSKELCELLQHKSFLMVGFLNVPETGNCETVTERRVNSHLF